MVTAIQRCREHGCDPQLADVNHAAQVNDFLSLMRGLYLEALVVRVTRAAPAVFLPVTGFLCCGFERFQRSHHADLPGKLATQARNQDLLVNREEIKYQDQGEKAADGRLQLETRENVSPQSRQRQ